MNLFAGIDAGQSSTTAAIGDESGRILARGSAGPADEIAQGAESTRLHDALLGALNDAVARAHLPSRTRFARIVAGISGYEGRIYGKSPQLPADDVVLVHDSAIAHAGALGGKPGVVVIAGTGSVAYAVNERGNTALVGGWGYLFGDEGSAFWIARKALAQAMIAGDAAHRTPIEERALQHFGQPSLRALSRAFYAGEISRADLAGFASQAIAVEARFAYDAASSLVYLADRAMSAVAMTRPEVAFVGGVATNPEVGARLDELFARLVPNAVMVDPLADPAEGALLMARR
jgi:glucosamine kinase